MDTPKTPKPLLKRRRCPNCQKTFQPTRPWARFDKEKCRKEFHSYGAGYYPIKAGLEKAIEKKYAELAKASKVRMDFLHQFCGDLLKDVKRLTVEVSQLRVETDARRGQPINVIIEKPRGFE